MWSVGVILYQMLYGRRPFGEGVSQETLLRDSVMLNANTVSFPSKPAVSAEGKDFINRQAGAAWVHSCIHRAEEGAGRHAYKPVSVQPEAAAAVADKQQCLTGHPEATRHSGGQAACPPVSPDLLLSCTGSGRDMWP